MWCPLIALLACYGLDVTKDLDDPSAGDDTFDFPGETGLEPIDTGDTPIDDNQRPIASAGLDVELPVQTRYVMDGSGSYDPDGDELTWDWTLVSQPSESSTFLLNPTWEDPEIFLDAPGLYEIELVVSDGSLDASDTVVLTAVESNDPPVANAGVDQSVTVGSTVGLSGGASYDPDGSPLTYQWQMVSKPSGSAANLAQPTSATPSFTADVSGVYDIELVVDDGVYSSNPDQVRVTASSSSGSSGGSSSGCSCGERARQEVLKRNSLAALVSTPLFFGAPFFFLVGWRRRD